MRLRTPPCRQNKYRSRILAVSRRFFNNTVLNFAGQGFLLVLTFATAPYSSSPRRRTLRHRRFGPNGGGFCGPAELGDQAGTDEICIGTLLDKVDVVAINELFQTAWGVCIVSGLLGLVLIIGPRETIGRLFFRGGPEINGVVGFYTPYMLAAFGLFSSMLLEGACAVPSALQKFGISNAISVFTGTLRYVGAVVALALGYSVRAVLVINLGANLITVAAFCLSQLEIDSRIEACTDLSFGCFQKALYLFASAPNFRIERPHRDASGSFHPGVLLAIGRGYYSLLRCPIPFLKKPPWEWET